MADDTQKPAEAESKTPVASPATASTKSQAAKPAARPRKTTATAPTARRKAPARTAAAAGKPPATRSAARKSPPAKKAANPPARSAAKANKADKPVKEKKAKLIRDSFTMPEGEYALIAALKKRCLAAGVSAKKSEILRAAVANLAKSSDASVVSALRRLEVIKTGRPAKKSK